jgi:hypothetical protein
LHAIGEKTIVLGAGSWDAMEKRQGISEVPMIRPYPVLVLAGAENILAGRAFHASANIRDEPLLDLYLSFDERSPERFADSQGRYDVFASAGLSIATTPLSRAGTGAALFPGDLTLKPRRNALFAPGSHVRDFSIEFWLYPLSTENGAQILSLNSSIPDGRGYIYQRVQAAISRNRLQWTFEDFFFSPGNRNSKPLSLSGPPLFPRTWSHHLIRFDADTGILEYLVDGRLEAVDYATSSGREGGEVYAPVIGEDPQLTLGNRFSGMMDEFRVHRFYFESPALAKYLGGGRAETRPLDLGNANSRVLRIEAFGGRTANSSGRVSNEYAGNGSLRFEDHAELNFFIRFSGNPYRWDAAWIPVRAGAALPDTFRGRYVQIAVDFYPGGRGESSPYLAELRVVYQPAEPPPPPAQVIAVAQNGAVELSWRASPSREVGGYMIYYGTASGEYFGESSLRAMASPINAGNRTSIRIEGLNNGTLYYFAVAAYERPSAPGAFSREVAARPLLRSGGDG